MKIAFFLAHYPSPGGTTKAVRGLAQALGKMEEVHILCLGEKKSEWNEDILIVHRFHRSKIPRSVPCELLKFLSDQKFDLVILNGMFTPGLAVLAFWLSKIKVPFVVAPHGPYHPQMLKKNGLIKRLYKPIEKYVLNKAKAVQVLSSSHIAFLRKYGIDTPTLVVPNGFDPKEIESVVNKENSITNEKKNVRISLLYLGRVDAYTKGLDLCIEAISLLPNKFKDSTHLIIQGPDWSDKHKLRKLSEDKGVKHVVHFLPPNYKESPVLIIKKYDCLILPSRYDGFGFVVLEAMLAKRPVIVSSQAGSAEHVVNAGCGIVVEPNPKSIATGIEEMIKLKSKWVEMGEKGFRYAVEHLTWEKIAQEALANYKKICGIRN